MGFYPQLEAAIPLNMPLKTLVLVELFVHSESGHRPTTGTDRADGCIPPMEDEMTDRSSDRGGAQTPSANMNKG